MSDLRDRARLRLVEGEPRTYPVAVSEIDHAGNAAALDVSEVPLALHVHRRGDAADAEPLFTPIAVAALIPNAIGYGQVTFTITHAAALEVGARYVFRLRKESGETVGEGDLYLDPAWS